MYARTTRFQRCDHLPSGEVDGELIALDLDRGDCFGLDRIGTAIWKRAGDPVSLEELVAELTAHYEVEAEACAADLQPFLRDMVDSGLLRIVS